MRGKASVPVRLGRMEQHRATRPSEKQIAILAEEYGLDPGEVRHELVELDRRRRLYGLEPVEVALHRYAADLGIDAAELLAEVEQTQERLRARGVVR